jgi:hypothetical protein
LTTISLHLQAASILRSQGHAAQFDAALLADQSVTHLPATADNPPRPLVMVGDLNNTFPQWKRGGGGIVAQHPHLSQLLRLMVVETGTP